MAAPQMHMTSHDREDQRARLRVALRYMKDDTAVAQVMGVSLAMVEQERAKLNKGRPPRLAVVDGVHEATYHINDKAVLEANTRACNAHLKLLLEYGIRHNSNLGMDADLFWQRAGEVGIDTASARLAIAEQNDNPKLRPSFHAESMAIQRRKARERAAA